jgi:DNA modification methylase
MLGLEARACQYCSSFERTGRRCAALELDPRYADVILARWVRFSGSVAERIDG